MRNRFGIKGRFIIDNMKHRQYPILGFRTHNSMRYGPHIELGWDASIYASVPRRYWQGYDQGDRQTFLRGSWGGMSVW